MNSTVRGADSLLQSTETRNISAEL